MNNEPVGYVYSVAGEPIKSAKINPEIPNGTPLYTHPAKHLSLQKVDGELVAVTYTDDEHRIIEVLWEKPPAKTLTDEEILNLFEPKYDAEIDDEMLIDFAKAILRKAQEK